jgi:hypothetical protein
LDGNGYLRLVDDPVAETLYLLRELPVEVVLAWLVQLIWLADERGNIEAARRARLWLLLHLTTWSNEEAA